MPGGRFSELYYWDLYFVLLGLAESGRRDLVEDMAKNFADLMDTYGHAPNGTRTYYLSRSQPPFFFEMVSLLSPSDPAAAFARYLKELKTEYAYWMDGADALKPGQAHRHAVALEDGSILNRYWDASDAPRGTRILFRGRRACGRDGAASARAVSRYARRRGERLAFQLAVVRGFATRRRRSTRPKSYPST